MKRHITALVVSAVSVSMSPPVQALTFGRALPSATLGKPLDVKLPLRVEADERFEPDCVHADVRFGDAQLADNLIDVEVTPGRQSGDWLIQVRSFVPVQEPVVEIGLTAGCGRKFTRRFTAFADPPGLAYAGLTPAAVAPATVPVPVPPSGASPAVQPLPPGGDWAGRPLADGTPPAARPARSARAKARAASAVAAAGDPAAATARRPAPGPTLTAAAQAPAARPAHGHARRVAGDGASRLVIDGGWGKLKLDMEDPVLPAGTAVAAAAAGASGGLSDLDALDPDLRRVQELQTSVAALKRETQANRARSNALQARLADAEARNEWLPWLLAALGLVTAAGAGLGWLLWRGQQGRGRPGAWLQDAQASAQLELDEPAAMSAPAPAPAATGRDDALAHPAAPAPRSGEAPLPEDDLGGAVVMADPMSATLPLERGAMAGVVGGGAAAVERELTVEELLDLEQQADFFIALGQEDAAVDLLMAQLRSMGGQSPLPYTKLLEIYRRQGDRAAYERTRARFNRRFNAYAPDWDTGPGSGRSLDDYPDTIAHIQAHWHDPLNAMAILDALLFKRDDASELFDLPAYRDVLVLFSVARDLWQQGEGVGEHEPVDLLLPLDDLGTDPFAAANAPVATAPGPLPAAEPAAPLAPLAPLAFELTGFDLLHEPSRDTADDSPVRATLAPGSFQTPAGKPGGSPDGHGPA